jgi:uncharacterized membrane protein
VGGDRARDEGVVSAAQSEAVVDRLAAKHKELGAEDFAAYAFLTLGLLAHHAPEVVAFILDRADERTTS